MPNKQKTIQKEFSLSGVGLHTGCSVGLHFKPAQEGTGIRFVRVDIAERPIIKVCAQNIQTEGGIPRCTSLGVKNAMVHTVEHLLATLCGLGIDNMEIEIDAPEVPGLDGSGMDFVKALKSAGIVEQNACKQEYAIREPVGVESNGSSIYVVPCDDYRISYTLNYDTPLLKSQFFSSVIAPEIFEKDIAPCRTFCVEGEVEALRKSGLGKGANYDNTLVVSPKGIIKNKTRFDDEFARHKVLDFIGDLFLLGFPIRGQVFAVKSGHELNLALLKKIQEQKERYEKKGMVVGFDPGTNREIDINGIMKILPHRYPFLLVDRVIELQKGKKAVGIKNVTINDGFFQGHFPTRPVMPGVLMVEAMAQTAGVVILTNKEHHGRVAFFMSIDNVKFRRVVVPGDQLLMEVEVLRDKSRTAQVKGVARVGGEIVAEAEMMFSFTDASYLD